ncbi:hypothetical protein C4564_06230 [Candidatus Microgenomates bacterium]|nr:MAG: hypothetical protein C4564_06230 [Candidatus Microgenomates bacterium]
MSKTPEIDLENKILSEIKSGKISMKPKWRFVLGSSILFTSLIGLSFGAIFMINLIVFVLRRNNFFYSWKFQGIVSAFPWWVPVVAVVGVILSVAILKRYDFSYKKNFIVILAFFVTALIISGVFLDKLGFNEFALGQRQMKGLYQHIDSQSGINVNGNFHQTGTGKQYRGGGEK